MPKPVSHIRSLLFCLFLLLTVPSAFAQNVEATEPRDSAVFFDTISRQQMELIRTREVPDSTLKRIRSDKAYWYANVAPEHKKTESSQERQNSSGTSWKSFLFWAFLVAIFLAALIWYLASSDIRLFRKPSKFINSQHTDEEISEDIFSIDYHSAIRKAVQQENYRMGVRLHFLQTIREMDERELISYKHELTNSDYLAQLSGTVLYSDFLHLTRLFEYVWYGKFDVPAEQFQIMQQEFVNFKNRVQR